MARTHKWLVRRVGVLVVLVLLGMVAGVWSIPDAHAASDPGPNLIVPPPGGTACLVFGNVTFTVSTAPFPRTGVPAGSLQAKGSLTNHCTTPVTNAKVVTDSTISNCSDRAPAPREFSSVGTSLDVGMSLIFSATATGLCYGCNVFHVPQPLGFSLTSTILGTATDANLQMAIASNPPTGGPWGPLFNEQGQLPFPC